MPYVTDANQKQSGRLPVLASDRAICLFVGLLMGLAVYGLIENAEWLRGNAHVAYPGWVLALSWPTLLLLGYRHGHLLRGLVWVSGFCALLALLAFYTGWQAPPLDDDSILPVWLAIVLGGLGGDTFGWSMVVACFVALIHLQPAIWGSDRAYATVFELSWRNFLTIFLSGLLVLGVWQVTLLWGELFELIGIEFFATLFEKDWFMCPILGMSFALGLNSFGTTSSMIARVSTLLSRFFWLLLPILALATTCFLLALPFTGLQPLWDSNLGTGILMAASVWGLFFLNAVYQTGERLPYTRTVHQALSVAIFLFPVLIGLAAYGLALRIEQDGLTLAHCWELLNIVLIALFSLGYAAAIAWRRDDWPSALPRINHPMSWVVLASLLLTASPLLDFRTISAWSYFSRVESGKLSVEDLDPDHLRELGRPGRIKLDALLERLEESDPQAALAVRARFAEGEEIGGWTPRQLARIVMRPEPFEVTAGLVEVFEQYQSQPPDVLYRVDLGAGETAEVVAVRVVASGHVAGYVESFCATWRDGGWVDCGRGSSFTDLSDKELLEVLGAAEFQVVIPDRPYKGLRIGEHLLLEHN